MLNCFALHTNTMLGHNPHEAFLCDFEIESHGCLVESEKVIKSSLPTNDIEIHFKNHSVDPGVDRPLLSIQVILSSESLETARDESKTFLKGYLDYLCFVANLPLRIHKQIRVVDWTPGLKERECHQFERFPCLDFRPLHST